MQTDLNQNSNFGNLGLKCRRSNFEAPIITITAALGNALADTKGVRFTSLPFSGTRIFSQVANGQ